VGPLFELMAGEKKADGIYFPLWSQAAQIKACHVKGIFYLLGNSLPSELILLTGIPKVPPTDPRCDGNLSGGHRLMTINRSLGDIYFVVWVNFISHFTVLRLEFAYIY
jgi:hypothetical protein